MSIIGEAILSVTVEMLIEKLVSVLVVQFSCQEQIQADLKKWEKMLMEIHAVLEDAEEKQTMKRSVKIWLDDFKNLAYDVEDILDEFATEALRRKLLLEPQPQPQPEACTSKLQKLRKIIPSFCTSFNQRSFKYKRFNSTMASQIEEINTRLQDIATRKQQLGLEENFGGRSKKGSQRPPATSLVNEAKVFGREQDKEAIVNLLMDDSSTSDGFSVVPIIGMGGVGKTTLAQLVYNDDRIESHFDFKAWVSVSEDFDIINITETILCSIGAETGNINDLNLLQVKLKQKLSEVKYLLVLDDIWNENPNYWATLSQPFEAGLRGSKIIVTTRNRGVSSMVGTLPAHQLKELSNEACLCIFTQRSLGRTDFNMHPDFKEIGEQIVKRCDGLPLAAKSLGGLLHGKYDINDWKNVLNSRMWTLPEEKCDIIPALKVSYYYLSSHLKRCFAYCSLFPKGYEYEMENIILLWMAEGLLQPENNVKKMEELGRDYFCELKSRSFFEESKSSRSVFVMHDLIHDLTQWAAGEIYFRMEDTNESDNQYVFSNNILRHLSYISGPLDGIEKLEVSNNIKGLRTFLLLMMQGKESFYLPREHKAFIHPKLAFHVKKDHDSPCIEEAVIHPKLWKLHCLRVLSLHRFCIRELPNQIGDLKHLRYLDLSYTCIESLPESVSALYNLQALVLEGCARLRKLCADIGNLINLHHVNIFKVDSLEQMPLRISKLTGLQTLSKFVVGKGVGSGIAELKSLTQLREMLHISRLENVHDANDVEEADLNGKENLNELVLEWKCSGVVSKPGETQKQVLGMLRPHQNMKKLIVRGYDGTKFPTWLGDFSFSKLECLKFQYCRKCISLPSVGQLRCLKDLVISGMDGVKSVGLDFYGNGFSTPFPSLEILHFLDMKEWEEWVPHTPSEEFECFPQLRELRIRRCPKLRGRLPKCLSLLNKLVIEKCKTFSVSVPSSPTLRELKIDECKEVEWSTVDLSSLKSVVLSRVSNRVSLAEGFMQGIPNLEELTISGCRKLTSFCETGRGLHQDISSLHPPLFSLVTEEEEEQGQKGLPCRLRYLELGNCECLDKLPQALHNLSSLREIYLRDCTNLVSFAGVGVPSQLKSIRIENCKALESFPEALISSSQISLETIVIEKCINLKSLPDDMKKLTSLQKIILQNCSSIVRFPERGLPSAKLKELWINGCEKLMALPNNMHNLSCLQELRIERCPGIVSFPEDGFPTNLAFLMMKDVNICKPLLEWGLHKLNSLRILYIRGGCDDVESFPQEEMEMTLPTSLTTIQIENFPNLERLSSVVQNLTSLKKLSFLYCPKLKYFPEQGLPPSILKLYIDECPLLEERCKKDEGLYWPMIAHLPPVSRGWSVNLW